MKPSDVAILLIATLFKLNAWYSVHKNEIKEGNTPDGNCEHSNVLPGQFAYVSSDVLFDQQFH